MIGTGTLKTSFVVGILLAAGALALADSDLLGVGSANDHGSGSRALTLPDLNIGEQVVAQLGSVPIQPPQIAPGKVTENNKIEVNTNSPATAPAIPTEIHWERPQAVDGAEPFWLAGGISGIVSFEKNRLVLAKPIEFRFKGAPLSTLASWLSEEIGTQVEINATELDLLGVDPDTPISVQGNGSVREFLRRALYGLELTYVITESTIEITSKDAADADPRMRFYDLSYVLPNPTNSQAVIDAIQETIDPDSWVIAGGTSSIVMVGSRMIISAAESTHHKIEVLLLNISRMNPKNIEKASPKTQNSGSEPGMGGMGGGMGGMGGGGMF